MQRNMPHNREHFQCIMRACVFASRSNRDQALAMEKPSLEVVLQALNTLHSNEVTVDAAQKSKADKWLTQLTESVSYEVVF